LKDGDAANGAMTALHRARGGDLDFRWKETGAVAFRLLKTATQADEFTAKLKDRLKEAEIKG
jgi:hypothetical protein